MHNVRWDYSTRVQSQKAVTAYLKSEQLLFFGLVRLYIGGGPPAILSVVFCPKPKDSNCHLKSNQLLPFVVEYRYYRTYLWLMSPLANEMDRSIITELQSESRRSLVKLVMSMY